MICWQSDTAPKELDRLLESLAPIVRDEILKDFAPDCCIATAAILRRVFRHFHFETTPIPVYVNIFNAAYLKLRRTGVPFPDDPTELRELMDRTGASAVTITEFAHPGKWPGHMLTLVKDILVDASLDFCNRTEHNITIPAFMTMPAHSPFLEFRSQLARTVNGCEIVYRRSRDKAWLGNPDWTSESRARRAVNAIIGRVDSARRSPRT
jgi:hypothetical protein